MATQFNHVQEQLSREQERLIATLNSLADHDSGTEIEFDTLAVKIPERTAEDALAVEADPAERSDQVRHPQTDTTDSKPAELSGGSPEDPEPTTEESAEEDIVSLEDLAEKAREAGTDEEKQMVAFRGMLASMFGIQRVPSTGDSVPDESAVTDHHEKEQPRSGVDSPGDVEDHAPGSRSRLHDSTDIEVPVDRNAAAADQNVASAGADSDPPPEHSVNETKPHSEPQAIAQQLAVTELREVANQAARDTLARHTQQKLQMRVWLNGLLACFALGLGGVYLQQGATQPHWIVGGQAAVGIGAVAVILCLRNVFRWRQQKSLRMANSQRGGRRHQVENRYRRYLREQERLGHPDPAGDEAGSPPSEPEPETSDS